MSKKYQFNDEDAKKIILLGQQGASQKAMYSAIGISKATAAKLKKENPVFAETMDLATTYGQAFWENMMLVNIENKSFNSRVAEIALRGQYPDDYRENRDTKVDLKAEISVDFGSEVAKLIESLKEAK